METSSVAAFAQAQQVIPGGVNSPARAYGAVGGGPRFIDRGVGSHLYDIDGREYIDYVCSWGPLILGHAHPRVVSALQEACGKGTSFGAPTQVETELAELIVASVPSIDMVRMVNSGTEATMSAVRLARGFTGRDKVLKFEGCWHGHGDSFLIRAGSSALTLGAPDSPGIPQGVADLTLTVAYNDIEAVRKAAKENSAEIAAIIVEPVAGNMGTVLPHDGFLAGLRQVADEEGIVLIFDEVITGFRVGLGGAQERFGITPDLTCLGKIVGGGLPAAAYGGRRDIMENVSPLGMKVSQAGTLSGNPLAMTAGLEQLKMLSEPGVYDRLERISASLADGMAENLRKLGLDYAINRVGGMLCMFFTDGAVGDFAAVGTVDLERFNRYFWAMLDRGVYLAPSQYECMFPSLAHTDLDIDETLRAHFEALKEVH
ncbi:MAG: glutamate-1-semialdehyde 2,1-aminomutase [Gemmatimonadetes bacterium]|nr:glutamate-1-semialdehyde 2,1-aminomutase [Gemmatimonadota bacterium]MBT5329187.1 glutamate-1-semialdehyde 2,1-aminomutase [Gemmatimonadota bacterium]MBT5450033.1 glutamate-1-semialdehyde 2,1-aminomutase [Gemmatimonadota bacterium]MBT5800078.1 glutamate-1-semialdehyde 2,1-aminomutase [Gemmatimonadota bacterium]MBT6618913.1 glutamate-1-semialdehyde 2,1-aminomutase [Gemmatimonadota bacterium]